MTDEEQTTVSMTVTHLVNVIMRHCGVRTIKLTQEELSALLDGESLGMFVDRNDAGMFITIDTEAVKQYMAAAQERAASNPLLN